MDAANTIPQLNARAMQAIADVHANDTMLRDLLKSVASAASSSQSSKALAPSVIALGRFAVDEMDSDHSLSNRVSEILGIYQAIVRAERRQRR